MFGSILRRRCQDDRVVFIFGPSKAVIETVRDGLRLLSTANFGPICKREVLSVMRRVHRHQRRVRTTSPARGAVGVGHGASRVVELRRWAGRRVEGVEGDGLLLPVHQIRAHGMTPGNVSPDVAGGVVLVEHVVFVIVVDETVGVVDPVLRRGVVELRPVLLLVGLRMGGGCCAQGRGQEGDAFAHLVGEG